jgi:hypothetical protein
MEIMILGGQLSITTPGDWRIVVAARGKRSWSPLPRLPGSHTHGHCYFSFFGTLIWLAFYDCML